MIESSPHSDQSGRAALLLIISVLVLFTVWVVLKTRTNTSQAGQDESRTKQVVSDQKQQTQQETRNTKPKNESQPAQSESNETGNQKSSQSKRTDSEEAGDSKHTDQQELEKGDSASETLADNNNSEPDNETSVSSPQEASSDSTEQTSSGDNEESKSSPESNEGTKEKKQGQQNEKQEQSDEQNELDDIPQKGEPEEKKKSDTVRKAEQLFDENRFSRAIKLLDREITSVDSEEKKERLRSKRSNWKEKYKENQRLYKLWLDKAETAVNNKQWKKVISHAEKATEYLPENEKPETLIRKAKQRKKYQNMVKISGGSFRVGDDQNSNSRKEISTFYIDRYEVTNAKYKEFMKETGHEAPLGWSGRDIPVGKKQHPVTGIRLSDARAYASWADKRLPTANEWEFAATGGGKRTYPWGDSKTVDNGTIPANTQEVGNNETVPVDEYGKGCTPDNVCHMLGNVAEWTRTRANKTDQPGKYVVKGGSYLYPVEKGGPDREMHREPDVRLIGIGFRCVKDPQ